MGGGEKVKCISEMTEEDILSDELMDEVLGIEDKDEQEDALFHLTRRAKQLKVAKMFEKRYKQMEERVFGKPEKIAQPSMRTTEFTIPMDARYSNMNCGSWVANMNGIVSYNVIGLEQRASYQPILPIERLENIENGEEQIVLAFYRDHRWKEIKVPKDVISSSNKIVALSKYGVSVTSENAKYLVKFLNDVENMNNEDIGLYQSTGKLGWHDNEFIPFNTDIIFDGDVRFRQLFESIKTEGHEDVWLDHVRELRSSGKKEVKLMLAASFASALIQPIGCLPFFVDLWGETEGGKSVTLMLASSVWANPAVYIGNYINTDTSFELTANMLNNIPLVLDDSSNMNKKIKDDIENIIYRLTAGRGKGRATKDMGMREITSWRLAILTNGERPLNEYVTQAGAINRIIEIEAGQKIFDDPSATAELLKMNYGFAGRRFIEEIMKIPVEELKKRYERICQTLYEDGKMQKQTMSLACILLADQIATETIFQDDYFITIDEAKEAIIDRNELSEGERCYRFLLDKVSMNANRFDFTQGIEKWGFIKDGYVCFYPPAIDTLCNQAMFSKKSFIAWAKKKRLLLVDDKGQNKVHKIDGKSVRAVSIKLDDGISIDENGFIQIDDDLEVPFE